MAEPLTLLGFISLFFEYPILSTFFFRSSSMNKMVVFDTCIYIVI
jgi:hypothetical protein